jgi:hypothetical protein
MVFVKIGSNKFHTADLMEASQNVLPEKPIPSKTVVTPLGWIRRQSFRFSATGIAADQARWLAGALAKGEAHNKRVPSVPQALKAGDGRTMGGLSVFSLRAGR